MIPANQTPTHPQASDDRGLVALLRTGSTEAVGQLFARHGDRAYRVARSVCCEAHAQDAVQQAFATLWDEPASLNPDHDSLGPWITTLTYDRAVAIAARHCSRHADPTRRQDDGTGLQAFLEQLPAAQRTVITLAFYGQLTHSEIGTRLGLPPDLVKGRMRLGLQRLRAHVDRRAA